MVPPQAFFRRLLVVELTVSLTDDDIRVLDGFMARTGLPSRSAAVQRAIAMLRHPDLDEDYGRAWAEWSAAGEGDIWDSATADGLDDAAR